MVEAPVAQWIERSRPKAGVGGSSPSGGARSCLGRWLRCRGEQLPIVGDRRQVVYVRLALEREGPPRGRRQGREVGRTAQVVGEDRLVDVDGWLEGEVAELLQPLLGAVQQPVGVREQRAVLEAEVDVLPLGADPGEVPDAFALGQGVGDPAPAGADRLDGAERQCGRSANGAPCRSRGWRRGSRRGGTRRAAARPWPDHAPRCRRVVSGLDGP